MPASKLAPSVCVLLAILPPAARAADLLPPPPPAALAEPVGTGWYLRGDFTRTVFDKPADGLRLDPSDPERPPLVGLRLKEAVGGGGGIGYHVEPWLRLDVTVDQRASSRFSGFSSRSDFSTGGNIESGRVDVLTGFLNAYADLGTWWGLTPYVGAGVGFADAQVKHAFTQTACSVDGCDGEAGTGARTAVQRPGRSTASFAYALTAGASYAIGWGVSVDAAYRYAGLAPVKTGADGFGGTTHLKGLAANEFRLGLRYDLSGLPSVPTLMHVGDDPYGN